MLGGAYTISEPYVHVCKCWVVHTQTIENFADLYFLTLVIYLLDFVQCFNTCVFTDMWEVELSVDFKCYFWCLILEPPVHNRTPSPKSKKTQKAHSPKRSPKARPSDIGISKFILNSWIIHLKDVIKIQVLFFWIEKNYPQSFQRRKLQPACLPVAGNFWARLANVSSYCIVLYLYRIIKEISASWNFERVSYLQS